MAAQPTLPVSESLPANENGKQPAARPRMSTRNRLLFFLSGWLLVLMPFLFWWNTWFGRTLTPKQMGEYLHDDAHPRHIQHALVQVEQQMSQHDPGAARWYGDLVRLSTHSREEVRGWDALVMGDDPAGAGFHDALLKMLNDPSLVVRGSAALSLVRFGDSSGRAQIVSLLQPVVVTSATGGKVLDAAVAGTPIHQGGLLAKIQDGQQTQEVRSPITGRVRMVLAAGATASAGAQIATVDPGEDQAWEALRALYLIGQVDDLSMVRLYERELPEISDRVRQQAVSTERAIQERASK